ncbi:MAG: NAD-dependent epimerase/dehydratase family protein [Alphaproteobacteria bacterium]|nr:MAG: NAD-dependent epimerase/dehydratase family protein [Alphaproteobacteria bacterium]
MRLFLTGVTGYVGRRVAEELVGDGHELAVLVRTSSDDTAARELGAWPIKAQLTDTERLASVAADVDGIAHCAASDDPAFLATNRAAVEAMMAALAPGAAFVMHGGSLVFGDTGAQRFTGVEPFDPPPFLAGRADLDQLVLAIGQKRRLRASIVHASMVYGEGRGAVIPSALVAAALRTGFAAYPGSGTNQWSTLHVRDWARLVMAALLNAPVGGTLYPAGGPPISMLDLAALIAEEGRLPPPRSVPVAEAQSLWGPLGAALTTNQLFSSEQAEMALGWTSERNGLPEEIRFLIQALRAN